MKTDPYVTKGLVEKYSVEPVIITHSTKEFDRVTADFIQRS